MQRTITQKGFRSFCFRIFATALILASFCQAGFSQSADRTVGYSVFTDAANNTWYRLTDGGTVVYSQKVSANSDVPSMVTAYADQQAQRAMQLYNKLGHPSPDQFKTALFSLNSSTSSSTTPLAVCTTFTGALATGDLTMGSRLSRPGAPTGSCALAYSVPATIAGGPFYYDTYSWTNTGAAACITTTLTTNDLTNANIQWGMYTTTFNPANLVTNYLADPGVSTGTPAPAAGITASVTVPAGATIIFVVYSTNPNTAASGTASDYTLTVDGCTASCTNPTLPTLLATPGTVASGSPSTLSVTAGTLNSATAWKWYSGSCGGTAVGTGTSVVVNPTVTTTYYCRGEGGCVTPGACASVTVTVGSSCVTPASATLCAGQIATFNVTQPPPPAPNVTTAVAFVAIPDNSPAGATHTLNVAGIPAGATITSVAVNLNITHTWDGDLTVNLKAPDNSIINLINGRGGSGDNFTNTTLSSASTTSLGTSAAPFTGTFAPDFNAALPPTGYTPTQTTWPYVTTTNSPNGPWTLALRDNANTDTGRLQNWTITITYTTGTYTGIWTPTTGLFTNAAATTPYTGTPVTTVYAKPGVGTTNYSVVINAGPCSGAGGPTTVPVTVNPLPTVGVTPATSCGSATNSLTASGANTYSWSPAAGLSATTGTTVTANPTANTVYTVTGTTTATGCTNTATTTVNYTPAAPTVVTNPLAVCQGTAQPLNITSAAGFGAPVTLTFTSPTLNTTIPENVAGISHTLNVAGIPAGAVITAASVKLNIAHGYVGDVMISLKAPNNNILNLDNLLTATNNPGVNFTNTVISSAGVTALSAGTQPWTGIFKADGNTAATGAFGVPSGPTGFAPNTPNFAGLYSVPNGPWTIAMYDAGPPDVGTLTDWTLSITYTPIVPFTGIWTPTTNLFLDAAGTVPYTGTSVSQVYAKPPSSTSYSVTIANGTCVSPATTIPVTVNIPVAVTSSPANASVCTDKTVTFTVAATGTGLSYQWQQSTDNGANYSNISNGVNFAGATTTTLSVINPPVSWNGYRYRVVVSGTAPCGPVNSGAAIMTVNPLPTITLNAAPYTRLFPGLTTTITPTVSPVAAATYTWFLNGIQIPGATASTYNVNVDGMGAYTVRITDVNGCTNTSPAINILDSFSTRLFIYPTPNNGQFQVRYYSIINNALPRYLYIYDAKGSRIYTQLFNVGRPYARMDVDITRFRSGTYWVVLADVNGNRLKVGRTIVP